MALSAQQIFTKFQGIFADNNSGQISEADLREFNKDLTDFLGASTEEVIPLWSAGLVFNTNGTGDGDLCRFADSGGNIRLWQTKTSNNTGNQPPSAPGTTENTHWLEVSASSGSAITEWAPGVYGSGLVIVFWADTFRKLNAASRPYTSTNIDTETANGDWVIIGGSPGSGSGGPAIENRYATIAALLAGQANQSDQGVQYVADASTDTTVDAGYAYYEYLGTTVGTMADYRKLSEEESMDVDSSGKADKVGGDNQIDYTPTSPPSWISSILTAGKALLRPSLDTIIAFVNTQVFKISDVDVSDINEGQFKIPLVRKVGGLPVIQGATSLIDKLAPPSILTLLGDNANWGNVSGKSGEFIILSGNNSVGALGENSQELYDNEGQYFLCISHVLENPGSATWVRNRSRDSLKIGVTQDDAVIAVLENETNWNTITNTKLLTVRSKPGSFHKSDVSGYLYHCFREAGTPPNNWYWFRSGLPTTEAMQILNVGNFTSLVTALGSHTWNTGAYDPSVLIAPAEQGKQGQEYYDVAARKLFKCLYNGTGLVWEQINLVKT